MRRVVGWIVAVALAASGAGCCADPYRYWQNARGWNDPVPDCFTQRGPFPKSTPPGPKTPAVEVVTGDVAR